MTTHRLRVSSAVTLEIPSEELSPRAAALMQHLDATWPPYMPHPVTLRSARTRREMLSSLDPERAADKLERAEMFGVDLDDTDVMTMAGWPPYAAAGDAAFADVGETPAEYAERLAATMPADYYPVADGNPASTDTEASAASRDQILNGLITAAEVCEILKLRPATLRSYVARGQTVQPVRHVGRTPLWDRAEVQALAESRRR